MTQNITGRRNIVVGANAAQNLTSGSGNIIIGNGAGAEITSENDLFVLDLGTIRIKLQMAPEQSRALYDSLNPLLVRAIEASDLERVFRLA